MVVSEVMGMEKIFLRYFINGKERRSKMMTWKTATIKNAEREIHKGNQEASREGGKGSEESVKKSRCTGYLVFCKQLHNGLAKTTIRMCYLTICRSGILKQCSRLVLTPDHLMMLLPWYHLGLQSLKAWIRLKDMLPRQFTYVTIVKKASAFHLMNFFIKERHNMAAKLPGSGWSKKAKEEAIASCDLVSEVTHYHFCTILWVTHVSSIQCVCDYEKHKYHKVAHLGGPLHSREGDYLKKWVVFSIKEKFYSTWPRIIFPFQIVYLLSLTIPWTFSFLIYCLF